LLVTETGGTGENTDLLQITDPWYSWNIVECGVEHHNPKSNPNTNFFVVQVSNKIQLFTDKIK
jgi:hypothetical protein